MSLRAGFAKVDITPPLGVPYLAFEPRQAPFERVHDPLFARALVIDNGVAGERVAIVSADALGFSRDVLGPGRDFVEDTRSRIAAHTGISPDRILIAATHAHSTPQTTHIAPAEESPALVNWVQTLAGLLVQSVLRAAADVQPARLAAGSGLAPGIAWNRRIVGDDGRLYRLPSRPANAVKEPRDDRVPILLVRRAHDCGILCNFCCHPVTVQAQPAVSADYPGVACRVVEEGLAPAVCMFLQGAAGDVNPVRHTSGFEDVEVYGLTLGREVLRVVATLLSSRGPEVPADLRVERRLLTLPSRVSADAPALRAEWEWKLSVERRQGIAWGPTRDALRLLDLGGAPVPCELQVLRLGRAVIAAVPGELFCEFGLRLRAEAEAGGATLLVAGYSNGYVGYLPSRAAYDEGGYETSFGPWTRVAAGAAETVTEALSAMIGDMLGSRG